MFRQPNPDYQVSPIDEPSSGVEDKSFNTQPGDSYAGIGSFGYETRSNWNLDAPSK
jgi:hypothetical protein